MKDRSRRKAAVVSVAGLAAAALVAATTDVAAADGGQGPRGVRPPVHHVLLISVDGMHQSDLRWYVDRHPRSALAALVRRGTEYTRARTPFPSDSFPAWSAS